MEKNIQKQNELLEEVLSFEVYEVDSTTLLEEMGASISARNCSFVKPTPTGT